MDEFVSSDSLLLVLQGVLLSFSTVTLFTRGVLGCPGVVTAIVDADVIPLPL